MPKNLASSGAALLVALLLVALVPAEIHAANSTNVPVFTKSVQAATPKTKSNPLLALLEESFPASSGFNISALFPNLNKVSTTTYSDIQKAFKTVDLSSTLAKIEKALTPGNVKLKSTFPNLAKLEQMMQGGAKPNSTLFPNLDTVSPTTLSDIQKALKTDNLSATFAEIEKVLNPSKTNLTSTYPNIANLEKMIESGLKPNISLLPTLDKSVSSGLKPNVSAYINKAVADTNKIAADIQKQLLVGGHNSSYGARMTPVVQNISRPYMTVVNATEHRNTLLTAVGTPSQNVSSLVGKGPVVTILSGKTDNTSMEVKPLPGDKAAIGTSLSSNNTTKQALPSGKHKHRYAFGANKQNRTAILTKAQLPGAFAKITPKFPLGQQSLTPVYGAEVLGR